LERWANCPPFYLFKIDNKLYDYHNEPARLVREIYLRKTSIEIPDFVPNDRELRDAYQSARVLDTYLSSYFVRDRIYRTTAEIEQEIENILQSFKIEVLRSLRREKEKFLKSLETQKTLTGFKNIFEFSRSKNLYLSNIYTRFITESLGHKFENIADLSDCVFIPDKNIGLKIKGIDLVIYDQGAIRYAQLKTKRDTLTGSQKSRSIQELKIHDNSIFAAALDMGKSWPIGKVEADRYGIERLAGFSFWSLINLDYEIILSYLSRVMQQLDTELYE
jgi:hypothetical protein